MTFFLPAIFLCFWLLGLSWKQPLFCSRDDDVDLIVLQQISLFTSERNWNPSGEMQLREWLVVFFLCMCVFPYTFLASAYVVVPCLKGRCMEEVGVGNWFWWWRGDLQCCFSSPKGTLSSTAGGDQALSLALVIWIVVCKSNFNAGAPEPNLLFSTGS